MSMDQKRVPVTSEGFVRLKKELQELIEVKRPEIIAQVADARSHGDLRENAAYDAARQDQAMIEKRIADLENMLRNVEVVEDADPGETNGEIRLGSQVVVDFGGDEEKYTVVGAIEAKPTMGLISTESPIGKALLGRKAGDKTEVQTPGGVTTILIKEVS
jgi:transcription elongation factor GreA